MRTQTFLALVFCVFFLASGCDPIYGPAIAGSNLPYQARSAYHGENSESIWVSGTINKGVIYGNDQESNVFLQGSIHKSHTRKHVKATYGGFIYGGSYNGIPNRNNLGFLGLGLRGSISANIPTRRVDFNLIGLQGGLTSEFGSYQKFRKDRGDYWGILTPSLNATTGFDIKGKNSSMGVELGLGFTGAPFSLHFTNQKFNIWGQVNLLTLDEEQQGNPILAIGAGFKL